MGYVLDTDSELRLCFSFLIVMSIRCVLASQQQLKEDGMYLYYWWGAERLDIYFCVQSWHSFPSLAVPNEREDIIQRFKIEQQAAKRKKYC